MTSIPKLMPCIATFLFGTVVFLSAVPMLAESLQLEARALKCKQCPRLVKAPPIRRHTVHNQAGGRVKELRFRRQWVTARFDILGAGAACSTNAISALLAAVVVRHSLKSSHLGDFGVTTNVSDAWDEPNIRIVASGPLPAADVWFRLLIANVISPMIDQDSFEVQKRSILAKVASLPERPFEYGSLLATTSLALTDAGGLRKAASNSGPAFTLPIIMGWYRQHYILPALRVGIVAPRRLKAISELAQLIATSTPASAGCAVHGNSTLADVSHLEVLADTQNQGIYVVGSRSYSSVRERLIALVSNIILGEGPESRLRSALRDERGFSYDVGSFIHFDGVGSPWTISASSSLRDFPALVDNLVGQLRLMATNGPTEEELFWAKQTAANQLVLTSSDPERALDDLMGPNPHDESIAEILETISPSDIARVVHDTFVVNCARIIVVGPKVDLGASGGALNKLCVRSDVPIAWQRAGM